MRRRDAPLETSRTSFKPPRPDMMRQLADAVDEAARYRLQPRKACTEKKSV